MVDCSGPAGFAGNVKDILKSGELGPGFNEDVAGLTTPAGN